MGVRILEGFEGEVTFIGVLGFIRYSGGVARRFGMYDSVRSGVEDRVRWFKFFL